jgi:LysR family cys regulon transcriptional activator
MNLNQLRFVREVVRQKLNLSVAAQTLFTSQPGVSKAIIELEDELGIQIFVRHGKRIKALTESGRAMLPIIERLLLEAENLRRVGAEFASQETGNLTLATTHTQARYTLPRVVQEFKRRYPDVRLSLLQGSPLQLAEMVLRDQADVAVATEAIATIPGLVSVPCFQWEHALVVPHGHPLLEAAGDSAVTLAQLARYPLVTYVSAFAGRTHIDEAFAKREIVPDIVLEAIDADVIKTYVEAGFGVGIVAAIAYDAERDRGLAAIPAGHLFGRNVTHLAVKRGAYLRGFVYSFIELVAPGIDRAMVDKLLGGAHVGAEEASGYQL